MTLREGSKESGVAKILLKRKERSICKRNNSFQNKGGKEERSMLS
jgi:hypothetical protein